MYMIDYKETRDIVSTEENRQLQTVISAEVLSGTSKNHLYKIKFKKQNTKQNKLRLYLKKTKEKERKKKKSKTNENNKSK